MKRYLFLTFLIPLIGTLSFSGCQSEPEPVNYLNESEEAFDQRMDWWRDDAFGMFIHWGPYAVPAGVHNGDSLPGIGEWIMQRAKIPVEEYENYARAFNPTEYDAEEWVRIARDAGMKYIVITSKHHDGFCLWDSKVTDYDFIDFSPFGRDALQELADACKKEGITLGFYHSIMDWHHPDAQAPFYPEYNDRERTNPNFDNYVQNYLKPQLKELVEKYDPAIIWFDGEWTGDWNHAYGLDMYNYIRNLKPSIIINNRVDKGRQGMQGMNKDDQEYAGDFGTPEQEILEEASEYDWESCMTMNDTWGYKSFDDNWKSAEMLIHNLADIVAKGGNYLLNVGPTAEGEIPEPSVERLAEMGDWMDVNGEAIYNTRRQGPYHQGEDIRFTYAKDGSATYAIALSWPGSSLELEGITPAEGSEIRVLGSDEALAWELTEDGTLQISLPEAMQDEANRPCKYAWTFRIENAG